MLTTCYLLAQMHDRTDKLVRNNDNISGENEIIDIEYSVEALFYDCNQEDSLYSKIKRIIFSVDDTLEETPRKPYVTFKLNKKNVISFWQYKGWIEVVLNAKLGTIND